MSRGGINWKLIVKVFLASMVAPWLCTYVLLLALVPKQGAEFWQATAAAVLIGATYLLTPAAAAYFAARGARQQPLVHAFLAVAVGLVAYLALFEKSLFAIVIWPIMGVLGVVPFIRNGPH